MRLKRLEIQGFKSFGQPVTLEFGPGITALVGPNGSGKSNISDALRWVLGEQSVRSLRGSRLEDIIFAGSDGKRPVGMAEVRVTLDNSDGYLPLDYSEVTITRRVYRSGDSEFFINKQSCRLKDIQDLFTDTGLGRESYAVVGQGQIDQVLSVRSEDRRILLEETAGIVKYRQRKEEALRKLEETSVDLLRVTDVLHELESQLGPLEEQAKQARLYLSLADQLRAELDYHLVWESLSRRAVKVEETISACRRNTQASCSRTAWRIGRGLGSPGELLQEIEAKRQELAELMEAYQRPSTASSSIGAVKNKSSPGAAGCLSRCKEENWPSLRRRRTSSRRAGGSFGTARAQEQAVAVRPKPFLASRSGRGRPGKRWIGSRTSSLSSCGSWPISATSSAASTSGGRPGQQLSRADQSLLKRKNASRPGS